MVGTTIGPLVDAALTRQQGWLDATAERCQRGMRTMMGGDRPPGMVMRLLHGSSWFGHPLHPALTDVPIGAWLMALILDVAGQRRGADTLIGLGVVGAMPTMMTGAVDWLATKGTARRIGFVHMGLNCVAMMAYVLSLAARAAGQRRLGIALSTAGLGIVLSSAYLGGELVFTYGTGVGSGAPNQEAEPEPVAANEPGPPESSRAAADITAEA